MLNQDSALQVVKLLETQKHIVVIKQYSFYSQTQYQRYIYQNEQEKQIHINYMKSNGWEYEQYSKTNEGLYVNLNYFSKQDQDNNIYVPCAEFTKSCVKDN